MLNPDEFKKGIELLIAEYGQRGFTMNVQKMQTWYNNMKDLADIEYSIKIENCLKCCKRVPVLADILDLDGTFREMVPPRYRPYFNPDKCFECDDTRQVPVFNEDNTISFKPCPKCGGSDGTV